VAIATDGYNLISRHNFLAQNLEAKIVSMVSVHCHGHCLASACYFPDADLYSMVYETESAITQLWKCFTVFPLRSACLAMYQTTMKTKGRQLQRAYKTSEWEILGIWAALN